MSRVNERTRMITVKEAAGMLKRSTKAVCRLIWSGALPAYKLGPHTIRLIPMAVERFAAAEEVQGR